MVESCECRWHFSRAVSYKIRPNVCCAKCPTVQGDRSNVVAVVVVVVVVVPLEWVVVRSVGVGWLKTPLASQFDCNGRLTGWMISANGSWSCMAVPYRKDCQCRTGDMALWMRSNKLDGGVLVVSGTTVRNNSIDLVLIKCACGCRKRDATLCRSSNICGTL